SRPREHSLGTHADGTVEPRRDDVQGTGADVPAAAPIARAVELSGEVAPDESGGRPGWAQSMPPLCVQCEDQAECALERRVDLRAERLGPSSHSAPTRAGAGADRLVTAGIRHRRGA